MTSVFGTSYSCPICKRQFLSKQEAQTCETKHSVPETYEPVYLPNNRYGPKFPAKIRCRFRNEKTAVYTLLKID